MERVLARLHRVRQTTSGWVALCPAHDDRAPSLSIRAGDDGRALVHCHAGCPFGEVVAALGLTAADMYPDPVPAPGPVARTYRTPRVVDHHVREASGALVGIHRRRVRADGSKRMSWLRPDGSAGLGGRPVASLPLYGSERVAEWAMDETIYLVEGEQAADALLAAGVAALGTVTGAATIPDDAPLAILTGRRIVLWPDADAAGRAHMAAIARRLMDVAHEVRLLAPAEDVPAGWDAADALTGAADPDLVMARLASRIGAVPVDTTDETRTAAGVDRGSVGIVDADTQWPVIDPLTEDAPLPPFPIDRLPAWVADMVTAVAANTETDMAMAAVTALGILSVPLSNRFQVRAPSWDERGLQLFTLAIAPSGELKSAVFDALSTPLREHERGVRRDEEPMRREQASDLRVTRTRVGTARDSLKRAMRAEIAARARSDGPEDGAVELQLRVIDGARTQLAAAERDLEEADATTSPPYALLADDSTPEALERQMAQQDGRVGIVSSESELFLMAAGRYTERGPNLQVYLSGYSGEPLRGDRITRDGPAVDHPGLAIVAATQPIVFEEAHRNRYLLRRGLLARFIYAVPESRAGSRHLANRPSVPAAVMRGYADGVGRLCRLGDRGRSDGPWRLLLVGEAATRLSRWHDERLEPQRHPLTGGLAANEAMTSWSARLHGTVARIAGILHVAGRDEASDADLDNESIAPETVDAAIAIGEWAIEHAHAAFGAERLDIVGRDAMRVRRWYRLRPAPATTFTVRDATRALRGMKAEQVRTALERLQEHGYVRVTRGGSGRSGGRPTERVEVHPDEARERVA